MTNSAAAILAKPTEPDAPRARHVFVLTAKRVVRQGRYVYHIPKGTVVGEDMLSPNKAAEQLGRPIAQDEKLMQSADIAIGSVVA